MRSTILILPFAAIGALILYLWLIQNDDTYSIYLIPVAVILAAYFIFRQQIDLWWHRRYPQKFDPKMAAILEMNIPPFRNLSQEDRVEMLARLDEFVRKREFLGQAVPELPDDIKYMTCAYPVLLTLHLEADDLDHYSRLVFYKHPFLTPNINDQVHVLEVEHEDGAIILSMQQLIPGFKDVKQFYNIALHAWSTALLRRYPVKLGKSEADIWKDIEYVGFVKKDRLKHYLGLERIDVYAVLMHYFISYYDRFRKLMPDYFEVFDQQFPMQTMEHNN